MNITIRGYLGNFGSRTSFSEAEFLRDLVSALPDEIEFEELEDYNSPYGHLLPEGFGGGDDPGFMQFVDFVVGLGTVEAFKIFAAAFLGRSGYLLADRLFKPISEEERKASLAKEKAFRAEYSKKPDKRPMDGVDTERWGMYGEKMTLEDQYGSYTIKVYIKEVKESHSISFEFDPLDADSQVSEWAEDRPPEKVHVVRSTSVSYPLPNSAEELQKILEREMKRILEELQRSTKA